MYSKAQSTKFLSASLFFYIYVTMGYCYHLWCPQFIYAFLFSSFLLLLVTGIWGMGHASCDVSVYWCINYGILQFLAICYCLFGVEFFAGFISQTVFFRESDPQKYPYFSTLKELHSPFLL